MEIATRRREQEVWQACDDLWALSGNMSHLTGDAIRERLMALGKSRGSPNEIYKYRKTWIKSRGISSSEDIAQEESDPIFRAVRIVHENLQNESNERIKLLEEEHEKQLSQKDEEIKNSKVAINSLMEEFSVLKRNLEQANAKLLEKSAEHSSELEVRKALEKEIALKKAELAQEIRAKDELLIELKKAHAQEIIKAEKRIDELSLERKLLGEDYSEKLISQKMALKNQEILTKEQEKKSIDLEQDLVMIREKISDKDKKIAWLIQENNQMADHISHIKAELLAQKASFNVVLSDRKQLSVLLRRAELQVSKLRTIAKFMGASNIQ